MLTNVADPNRSLLARAPVNLVVFTLSYGATEPWGPQTGVYWRELLRQRDIVGKLVAATQHQLTITLGAQSDTRTRSGHQIAKEDGSTATLYEDSLVLEDRNYPGWAAYRGSLESILAATAEQRGVAVTQSISLRYVNALSDARASSMSFWRGRVAAEFLGAVAADDIVGDMRRAAYMLSFSDGSTNAELRSAIQPDAIHPGCQAFVFDMEFLHTDPAEFVIEAVLQKADHLNTLALKLFQRILLPDYLHELTK